MFYEKKVRYLDYYRNGERIRNGGFARTEMRGDNFRFELTLKGIPAAGKAGGSVILCAGEKETVLGEIGLKNGVGEFLYEGELKKGGGAGLEYEELTGIRIPLGEGMEAACRWPAEKGAVTEGGNVSAERKPAKQDQEKERRFFHRRAEKEKGTESDASIQRAGRETVPDVSMQGTEEEMGLEVFVPGRSVGTDQKAAVGETGTLMTQGRAQRGWEPESEQGRAQQSREPESEQGMAQRGREPESEQDRAQQSREPESEQGMAQRGREPESEQDRAQQSREPQSEQGRAQRGREPETEQGMILQSQETEINRDIPLRGGGESRKEHSLRREDTEKVAAVLLKRAEEGKERAGSERNDRNRIQQSDQMKGTEEEHTMSRIGSAEKKSSRPVKLLEEKWLQLSAIYPHIRPFQDERDYLSIGPSDFVIFSEESYRAVNNSFLLHGYYNYHHLILTRMERRGEILYYAGVPGNYYDREKQVAVMFGFESFECAEEPAQQGDFGYYMMRVKV